MEKEELQISRHISKLGRLTKIYYDRLLAPDRIGWGQQYFLWFVQDSPGITPQMLTEKLRVDKGTTSKAIKKLYAEGYIRMVEDNTDRRVKRLYATEIAFPVVLRIKEARQHLHTVLTRNFTAAEMAAMEQGLQNMTENLVTELIAQNEGVDSCES